MAMTSQLFLGIDAGGTKTQALIVEADGTVRGSGRSGCGNWEAIGLDGAGAALAQAIDTALAEAGAGRNDIVAAGYGMAGVDWPSDEPRLAPIIAALGIPGPYQLVNDSYVALAAGSHDATGVAVIAGTGSVVAGTNARGERFRTFGVGSGWGDVGGAYDLVTLAIRAACFAYYGRGAETTLTGKFLDAFKVASLAELIEGVSRGTIAHPGGEYAPLVTATANEGDPVAQKLCYDLGTEIGRNVSAIAQRLELHHQAFDLVLAGSVLCSGCAPLIDGLLSEVHTLAPEAVPVVLGVPPVVGGVVLAMQAAGTPLAPAARIRLTEQMRLR